MLRPKFRVLLIPKPPDWFRWNLIFGGILRCFLQISTQILLLKTFKISLEGNIWIDKFRKSRVPPDKLVAMVMLDNLGNKNDFYAK